jgi:hypothetical protein
MNCNQIPLFKNQHEFNELKQNEWFRIFKTKYNLLLSESAGSQINAGNQESTYSKQIKYNSFEFEKKIYIL